MTTLESRSSVSATNMMASASAVSANSNSFGASSFHNCRILSPNCDDSLNNTNVSLSLSSSSSFLNGSKFICNSTPIITMSSAYTTTSTLIINNDIKENDINPLDVLPIGNNIETNINKSEPAIKSEEDNSVKVDIPLNVIPITESKEQFKIEVNQNENTIKSESPEEESQSILIGDFDENSCNSNSQSSSGSSRKKRRRGEEQILMEDLTRIDKSLAEASTFVEPNGKPQSNSSTGENESKPVKEDSPAFRLRPRRSTHKSSFSGYCSSGSSSPIAYLSPIKKGRQNSLKRATTSYTDQLLHDTQRQIQLLSVNDSTTDKPSSTNNKSKVKIRSCSNSVLVDMDISVFVDMISPYDLNKNSNYDKCYVSLKIIDIKPLRYVSLNRSKSENKIVLPLLEFVTTDFGDRFELEYAAGFYDDSAYRKAPNKQMTVSLLGTYATMSVELAQKGHIMNMYKFRTTNDRMITLNNNDVEPPVKRKLLVDSENVDNDNNNYEENLTCFPFSIIVDSDNDTMLNNNEETNNTIKDNIIEKTDDAELPERKIFEELYQCNPKIGVACEPNWVPIVSYSKQWRRPNDPKELNKTLYVLQPCIPKFESASRTVKIKVKDAV